MTNKAQFDRNILATVKPGLDSTLAEITAQMERYLSAPGANVVALEKARTELHSLLGVLKMVGLDGVAVFCTELATTLSELAANPQQVSAMHRDAVRSALFAITHYLDALANGMDNAALRLFAQYQALQQLRGLEMSFELDLFYPNLDVQLPPQVMSGPPPSDASARLKAMRGQFQQGLLRWLRQEDAAAALQQMQQALNTALRCVAQDGSRAFWWVAGGLLECVKLDGIPPEMNVRKLLGRIDQQLRTVAEGQFSDVTAVMNEMLYLIGRSHALGEVAQDIKQVYALDNYLPEQSVLPPGEVEQLLAVMHDQLRVAEESWELCVQGDKAACEKFLKYVEQLSTQSDKLDRDVLQYLTKQIQELSQYASSPEHCRPISIDMAMALLLLGSGIENYSRLGSAFQEQARILTERMQAAVKQQPEDTKRLTELIELNFEMDQRGDVMGPLANEMLVNLQHVEQGLNAFFNDAAKRDGLTELLRLLNQIQGGFRISSLTHAEHLLTSVQDRVRRFAKGNELPRPAERYALADALSALENYMQHLTHGQSGDVRRLEAALSEMVKLDQAPEPAAPAPAKQQPQAPVTPVAAAPVKQPAVAAPVKTEPGQTIQFSAPLEIAPVERAAAPLELSLDSTMLEFSTETKAPSPLDFTPDTTPQVIAPIEVIKFEPPPEPRKRPTEEEQELLDIFLEEAREVLVNIRSKLDACRSNPGDHESLVTIRRGFHTLKGSGRMVGLNDLGEVAWSVERALNKWLQENKPATPGLLEFIDNAVQSFDGWVEVLAKQGFADIEAAELVATAQQVESSLDSSTQPPVALPAAAHEAEIAPSLEAVSGETEMSPALFDIASTEARQNAAILRLQFEELHAASSPVVHYDFMRAAHTLAGVNRTMGFAAVAELASALEGWLEARVDQVFSLSASQAHMLDQSIAALDRMVQSIAEQQIPEMHRELADQLLADRDNLVGVAAEMAGPAETAPPIMEPVPQHQPSAADIENEIPQPGTFGFDQLFADIGMAVGATETPADIPIEAQPEPDLQIQQPEADKPEASDEMFANLLADIGSLAEAAEQPAESVAESTPQSAAQLMVDAGKIGEPAAAVSSDTAAVLQPVVRTIAKPADAANAEGDKPQVYDDLDDQLLPVFLEEADDLGPKIGEGLRAWRESPQDEQQVQSLKRLLHTMKGSSRMVGAMRIGEIAHEMEDRVAAAHLRDEAGYWDGLESDFDRITALLEELRGGKPVVEVKREAAPAPTPAPNRRATDQPAGVERRAERRGEAPLGN
ncbi:MAG: Hpt domain-containing protein, partial [Gallionella sp.]